MRNRSAIAAITVSSIAGAGLALLPSTSVHAASAICGSTAVTPDPSAPRPDQPTLVSSDFMLPGTHALYAPGTGNSGVIQVHVSGGTGGIACFEYLLNSNTFSGVGTNPAIAPDVNGDASIIVSPVQWGTNYLAVRAIDHAGNISDTGTFSFFVPSGSSYYPVLNWNGVYGETLGAQFTVTGAPAVGSGSPVTSYQFDFGDGHTTSVDPAASSSAHHVYASPGTYAAAVRLLDAQGAIVAVNARYITVPLVQPPAPTPTPTPTPIPTPAPGNPAGPATVHRIGGGDRYETARMVSQAQWKDGTADAVVLARGDQAPDALAGVPLAAHVHGPLLLTDPKSIDRDTSAEIARVTGGPSANKKVYILGGDSAVSPSIESGLQAAGYTVVRYKGTDRFGTALAVASAFGNTQHVIVATGRNFPDALAAGPLGAVENAPIVLSDNAAFDPATAAFVLSHQAIDPVGGYALRAVGTLNTTGKVVNRSLFGPSRYETAVAVADMVAQITGHVPTGVGIASGLTFPDALTGGAYAANAGMPLLITEPTTLSGPTRYRLSGWINSLTFVTVFGGTAAVNEGVVNDIAAAVHGKIK
ncbi:MAG: cell wall-binding repeat-containing protein [Catenulispora sp.]